MKSDRSLHQTVADPPIRYLILVVSAVLLVLAIAIFQFAPLSVPLASYRTPVLTFLTGITFSAAANVVFRLMQKSFHTEAIKALREPIDSLDRVADKLRQVQFFYEAGVVGVFANRRVAMQRFMPEIEREDRSIEIVGTSFLGSIDPAGEGEDKRQLHALLLQKRLKNVRIRALLMHPAYGEFRERVENRARAMVAKDIQTTLRFLLDVPQDILTNPTKEAFASKEPKLLTQSDVRLYPGVVTAFVIFTSRSMLVNLSTLHGPVYDNLTLIVEDRQDPNSLYKRFRGNHFEEPWRSEKTIRLDGKNADLIQKLLSIDFTKPECRFAEGDWPKTILQD